MITVSDDGENAIVVIGGANADLTVLSPAQLEQIGAAAVVVAQLEIPLPTVLAAARARMSGALFVLNAAPSAPLAAELVEQVDVLVVNEHELADLAPGREVIDGARHLLAQVGAVVVTLGAQGCVVVEQGGATRVPAVAVTAVDTTGAGDTFCGVLAARLAAGDELVEAARWGSAAAAIAVQRPGAQDAVPAADEVARLRKDQR